MIEAGRVSVDGIPQPGAATLVAGETPVRLAGRPRTFVSRGGEKLDGALADLDVEVAGRRWLDAGASTGGFTDRLLRGGAIAVAAVDVGYGQLAWELRNDRRVVVLERTNVRGLEPADLPWQPDGVVADLSFISLRLVLEAFVRVVAPGGDHLLLVKPQFEVGKADAGRGVVRDPRLWAGAISAVVERAAELSLGLAGVTPSALPGPAGNREFFVHLKHGASLGDDAITRAVESVT